MINQPDRPADALRTRTKRFDCAVTAVWTMQASCRADVPAMHPAAYRALVDAC
ncbi:hypothetical protein ACMGDM_09500 [Sphingomonas sp. DT-51]|uniref:hypothetical protein n=1 Tax=Sphingomonas sp. DT-51 TaxID=3396165 RepID=UPI003F1C9306